MKSLPISTVKILSIHFKLINGILHNYGIQQRSNLTVPSLSNSCKLIYLPFVGFLPKGPAKLISLAELHLN